MMSADTHSSEFFVAGGTLRPGAPSYIKRPADDELFNWALAGEFCYVLTPRQMGKSSLMIRTAQRLREQKSNTAIIDLTKIGANVSAEQWYLGLIARLKSQLKLTIDPHAWWKESHSLGAVQRFTSFLRDVVLEEIEGSVVIFMDEIDTTLNLEFSDDFFAAIRFTYNARATDPAYDRLTFILLGVATPADLIQDRSRTPFNIGQRIDLREFSQDDAQSLRQGLNAAHPQQGEAMFARIFYWTNGHPYLTQKLCLTIAQAGEKNWTDDQVDELVKRLFVSEEARRETNLQFVRDRIGSSPRQRRLLALYRQVYENKAVPEDERSLDQNRLKLFGLVRAADGALKVRNEIYHRVFDLNWIKTNTPVNWTRRIAAISTSFVLLLVAVSFFLFYRQAQETTAAKAQAFIDDFRNVPSPDVRVTRLAELLAISGYKDKARQLFQELDPEEQRAMFDLSDPQAVGSQLVDVIKEFYTDLGDNEQDRALLDAMAEPLDVLIDPTAVNLATEIEKWQKGREYYAYRAYRQAIEAYNVAIGLNDRNPGTWFDQALAYVAMEAFDQASESLAKAIELNPTNADWHLGLGNIYLQQRDMDKALQSYTQAIELNPTNADWHLGLGSIYLQQGDMDKALQSYTQAIELNPTNADWHWVLGDIYRRQRDLDKAVQAYANAVDLEPTNHERQVNLGWYAYENGDYQLSVTASQAATLLDPTEPRSPFNSGLALVAMGDVEEAWQVYRDGIIATNALDDVDALDRYNEALGDLGNVEDPAGIADALRAHLTFKKALIYLRAGLADEVWSTYEEGIAIAATLSEETRRALYDEALDDLRAVDATPNLVTRLERLLEEAQSE